MMTLQHINFIFDASQPYENAQYFDLCQNQLELSKTCVPEWTQCVAIIPIGVIIYDSIADSYTVRMAYRRVPTCHSRGGNQVATGVEIPMPCRVVCQSAGTVAKVDLVLHAL